MTREIVGKECRFAVHIPAKHGIRPDLHLIKEQVHYSDGTIEPRIGLIKDYKRPGWITSKAKQNHTQKKEWEHVDNLLRFECTESELRDRVAKALDKFHTKDHLKKLSVSPYLYGTDVTSTAWIKHDYQKKYATQRTPYSVAVFDIETHEEGPNTIINMATVAFQNKTCTAVLKSVVAGYGNAEYALDKAMREQIPEFIDGWHHELHICDNEVELLKIVFQRTHEWKPDLLAIWNINYDIPKVLACLERHRVKPTDVLCDPMIPEAARICHYKEGPAKKVTASGKVTPISPANRWHVFTCTASFYVIDAMCLYRVLRLAKPEEPSYSLDAILAKEKVRRKLAFSAADGYSGMQWHDFMRERYPAEYIVYNRYDCISILMLDEKIKDLSFKLAEFAGITDFGKFNSQPKKIADAMFMWLLERGYVLGTVGFEEEVEEDELDDDGNPVESNKDRTLGLKGWICTLAAELQVPGLAVLLEDTDMLTNCRMMVYDSDAVAAYPTATECLNVSKETTVFEIINIEGIPKDIFMMQNINLLGGPVNAIEYCVTMFNFPKPQQLLELMNRQ